MTKVEFERVMREVDLAKALVMPVPAWLDRCWASLCAEGIQETATPDQVRHARDRTIELLVYRWEQLTTNKYD